MTNASVLGYQIFSADKAVAQEAIERLRQAEAKINARSNQRNANSSDWLLRSFFPREMLSATNFAWWFDQPSMTARAMALDQRHVVPGGLSELDRRAGSLSDARRTVGGRADQSAGRSDRGPLWRRALGDGQGRRATERSLSPA
jgi:hypothetical protein